MKVGFSDIYFKANKVSLAQAEYFKKVLENSKNVNIICHTRTDIDSAACAATVADYLEQKGINSKIIISQEMKNLGIKDPEKYNCVQSQTLTGDENVEGTTLCVDFCSSDRLPHNSANFVKNADKLLCIDHHRGVNLVDHDYIYINSPIKDNNIRGVSSFYIDSSAKSATSIVYRFMEALGEDVDNQKAYNLFMGLVDDATKRGFVSCDGKNGKISLLEDAQEDGNFCEVYNALAKKLTKEQITEIAKKIDRTSELTESEQKLNDSLYDRIQLFGYKKIAAVVIDPDDELWEKCGGDTPVVSTILNRFRQNVLNNKFNDSNLKDVQIAMVFYKVSNTYRVSLHSKDISLHPVYKYIEKELPAGTFSIGGHTTRGGGKISATDKDSCKLWVNTVIRACENCL